MSKVKLTELSKKNQVVQCKNCNISFLKVDWLTYRVNGYCSKGCDPDYVPKKYKRKKKEGDWFKGFDNELLGNGNFNWNKK